MDLDLNLNKKRKKKRKGQMSFPNTSHSVPFGENNVNLSVSLNSSDPTNWSNVKYLLRKGCYFFLTSASLFIITALRKPTKGTTFTISNPYSRFVLNFQYSRYHITLKNGEDGTRLRPQVQVGIRDLLHFHAFCGMCSSYTSLKTS